jgi:chromate transporter
MKPAAAHRLAEVAGLFLKLGLTAFGGPAAHIAMLHEETVTRRHWLTEQEFLDLVGATNLIPGPNSTEMAIHLGLRRAGWPGLVAAGLCFITPAMLIVLALAAAYVRFGSTPQAEWLLYGVKPVVIAIILQALWTLGRTAIRAPLLALVAGAALLLSSLGAHEIALLIAGGALVAAVRGLRGWGRNLGAIVVWPSLLGPAALAATGLTAVPFTVPLLFLTFLKIGAILYGSGYVLLAFLRADFVVRFGWLTDQQLIDAIAVGQVTPGPLFTSATFIGYLLGGIPAGVLATLGIFLPSFVFVALSQPLIPRLRRSAWASSVLDGVTAASLGLMAAVTVQLGRASFVDAATVSIALAALVLLLRFKVNATWLVAAGALAGLLVKG